MKILFTTLIWLLLTFAAKAQTIYNDEGEQVPFALADKYKNLIDLSKIKTCTLKSYDNDSLFTKYNKENNEPFGEQQVIGLPPVDTLINLKIIATKYKIKEGTLWLYKIESKTAEMLSTQISIPDIPKGAYLCLFPKKQLLQIQKPRFFYKKDIIEEKIQDIQFGNQLFIEYFEPNGSIGSTKIIIEKIHYIFSTSLRNKSSEFEENEIHLKSGSFGTANNGCQYNVVCPEVSSWAKESRSIAFILYRFLGADGLWRSIAGTGFFINKSNSYSDNDQPYIITAGHVLGSWTQVNGAWTFNDFSNQIHNYQIFVNYRDENCTDVVPRTGQKLSGTCSVMQKGTSYNKNGGSDPSYEQNEDFALLRINQTVSSLKKYNILYAGWTSTPQYYSSGYAAIGHPHRDVQKVLIENNAGTVSSNGKSVTFFFDKGVAESGCSGSPVFNSSKKLVGWICTIPTTGSCSNVGLNIDATDCGRFDRLYFNVAQYIDPTNIAQANDSEPTPPAQPTLPAHCNNCLQDVDETGIDCGGTCLPCGMQDNRTIKTQADITSNDISARYSLSTEPDPGYKFEYLSGTFNLKAGNSVSFKNNVLIKSGVNLKVAIVPSLLSEPPRGCSTSCFRSSPSFTPNGDGIDDYWYFNQAYIKSYSFIVTNSWGNTIYTKPTTPIYENGTVKAWDGTGATGIGGYIIIMTTTNCNGTTTSGGITVSITGFKSATIKELQDNLTSNESNIEKSEFKIIAFPNPTEGRISVESYNCDLVFDCELTDMTGKVLNQVSNIIGSGEIDLSSYPSGMYLLRVKSGENIQLCKLIKK